MRSIVQAGDAPSCSDGQLPKRSRTRATVARQWLLYPRSYGHFFAANSEKAFRSSRRLLDDLPHKRLKDSAAEDIR